MATNFPTSVDNFTNPTANDSLNLPSHSTQHANANDAIEAIEGYLLNGGQGLKLIKKQTVGVGVSSVVVSDVFSSTFQNYRVVLSGIDGTSVSAFLIVFGSTATGYYYSQYYDSAAGNATGTDRALNQAFGICGIMGADADCVSSFDISNPFANSRTTYSGSYFGHPYTGFFGCSLTNTTSYTSFTLSTSASTMTGGTISVYGYGS